ncbi:MAG: ribonuclease HIII [Verrucomicrobia bacterium]|nr:MAG: ribonuclease HIII [Verrucomicrobiota bacterium]
MPKSSASDSDAPKKLASYTVKLTDEQMTRLGDWLATRGWERVEVAYTRFAFRNQAAKVNVTGYESRKVVIAGKGTEEFVSMVIEPEITGAAKLGYDEVLHPDWFETHAGCDESGKGDFFGPLIAATVIGSKTMIEAWRAAGAQDSKKMSEAKILELDKIIRATPGVVVKTISCRDMRQYNQLMGTRFRSQNQILAFQHARALQEALAEKAAPWGLLDQFTEDPLVARELAKLGVTGFELRMRTKAEEDPVVAAASIVARAEYVRQMHQLSKKFGEKLQKGASAAVKTQAHEIIRRFGADALRDFAKLHFRTAYEVVSAAGKLDELPLKPPPPKMEW